MKPLIKIKSIGIFLFFWMGSLTIHAQPLRMDKKLSAHLQQILKACKLDSVYKTDEAFTEQVCIAVIPLVKRPVIGGVGMDRFIYPASMYKAYVAMEVEKQIVEGKLQEFAPYVVQAPNDVDRSKEIDTDPRPLLHAGDTLNIRYLLDLMITRSDNSAANCLIDIADRKNINTTMQTLDWQGSEVTRKFLSRKKEAPGYDTIRGTQTTAAHFARFLYLIARQQLINAAVSTRLQSLLCMQLDKSKLAPGFPATATYCHKTGWWSHYTHDAGIVQDGRLRYVIAVFTPVKEHLLQGRLTLLAQKVHAYMQQRYGR